MIFSYLHEVKFIKLGIQFKDVVRTKKLFKHYIEVIYNPKIIFDLLGTRYPPKKKP